jgi:hypothetical protein
LRSAKPLSQISDRASGRATPARLRSLHVPASGDPEHEPLSRTYHGLVVITDPEQMRTTLPNWLFHAEIAVITFNARRMFIVMMLT